jgi:hypothetical protein
VGSCDVDERIGPTHPVDVGLGGQQLPEVGPDERFEERRLTEVLDDPGLPQVRLRPRRSIQQLLDRDVSRGVPPGLIAVVRVSVHRCPLQRSGL